MSQLQLETPYPYRDDVCWHAVGKRGKTVVCQLDARKYAVRRKDNGSMSSFPSDLTIWLCAGHKEVVEDQGFTCTLI